LWPYSAFTTDEQSYKITTEELQHLLQNWRQTDFLFHKIFIALSDPRTNR
jgi:hypothetical protein